MNPHELLEDWNASQTQGPAIQHPPLPSLSARHLNQIYRHGADLPSDTLEGILFQDKQLLRHELRLIIQDAADRADTYLPYLLQFDRLDCKDPDFPDPTYFLAHAVLLRKQIGIPGILEDLNPLLSLAQCHIDAFFDHQTQDSLLFAFTSGGLEPGGIETLTAWIMDEKHNKTIRQIAIEALGQCAHHQHALWKQVDEILLDFGEEFKKMGESDLEAWVWNERKSLALDSSAPEVIGLFESAVPSSIPGGNDLEDQGSLNNWAKKEMPPMVELLAIWNKQNRFAEFQTGSGNNLGNPYQRKTKKTNTISKSRIGESITPRKVGRNEPCPCGSGLKYKKCHGK